MGEIPSNPSEYEQTPEALLTVAVDLRLSPLAEHQPIQVFEGPIKGIKRAVQLVEGDPLEGRSLYLEVSSGLESGAIEQYSVRAYNQNTWESTTYTWTAGEPIKVEDQGEDRGLQESEIENLTQRIYDAQTYEPRKHKIEIQKQRQKDGTTVHIRVVGEQQPQGIGRTILNAISKLKRH